MADKAINICCFQGRKETPFKKSKKGWKEKKRGFSV